MQRDNDDKKKSKSKQPSLHKRIKARIAVRRFDKDIKEDPVTAMIKEAKEVFFNIGSDVAKANTNDELNQLETKLSALKVTHEKAIAKAKKMPQHTRDEDGDNCPTHAGTLIERIDYAEKEIVRQKSRIQKRATEKQMMSEISKDKSLQEQHYKHLSNRRHSAPKISDKGDFIANMSEAERRAYAEQVRRNSDSSKYVRHKASTPIDKQLSKIKAKLVPETDLEKVREKRQGTSTRPQEEDLGNDNSNQPPKRPGTGK